MAKNAVVTITSGTNDQTKVVLAVLSAFALAKKGNKVTIVMMGDAGNVVATDQMLKLSGFGFPPIEKFFNDDVMINDVEWIV
jgi:predicted peroxiredoxin